MIAPRELAIEAFEERFAKYPVLPCTCELADNKREKQLGLILRKHMKFYTYEPVVNLNHDYSHNEVERRHRKKAKPVQAYDIPKWRKAKDLLKHYY
jgi:hypothetical protein